MVDLDDEKVLRKADPGEMLAAVEDLPEHCRDGYRTGRSAAGLPSGEGVSALAFCGMGGSGVAGAVVRALYRERLRLPVDLVRDSVLPEYCGPHTLVVCCSYSGNTAETLACFDEAVARGARIVVVTSGGELARRAEELELAVVGVPQGFQPRAAFGHLALGSLGALESIGLIPPLEDDLAEAAGELDGLSPRLGPAEPRSANRAKALAVRIGDRMPVIWGAEGIASAAARRWRAQMNENAKVPAFASSLPELDHNEVVGWSAGAGGGFFLVTLRHEGEPPQVAARFPLSLEIARESGMLADEEWATGRSALARLLSLVMVGDFTSVYLGLLRDVDPTPTRAIERVKRALAEA